MRPEPPSGEQNDARTAAGARPQRPPESSPTQLSPSDRVLAGRVLGVKTSESGCSPVWPASVFTREAEVPGTVPHLGPFPGILEASHDSGRGDE